MWKWKLFQFCLMVWLMVQFNKLEHSPDPVDQLLAFHNPAAAGFVAFIITFLATDFLIWIIWLPKRLQYRWQCWRSDRRAAQ